MDEYLAELSGRSEDFVIKSKRFELTAKVCHFSDESIHTPGEPVIFYYVANITPEHDDYCTMLEVGPEIIERRDASLYLWANGTNEENRGYISLRLTLFLNSGLYRLIYDGDFAFSCTVSVIDSSGKKRFLRSFTFPNGPERILHILAFDVDRYIKRETLLSDPLDLLPGDCLTLCIEATMQGIVDKQDESVLSTITDSFETKFFGDHLKHYLSLDSAVGERLKEESIFFQNMLESGMKESTTGIMEIPDDEFLYFFYVCDLLMRSTTLRVRSLHEICEIYRLSDKYDIPAAIEICRRLVISLLRDKNVQNMVEHFDEGIQELLQLAERIGDRDLEQIVESFLQSRGEGAEDGERTEEDVQANLDTEWEVSVKRNASGMFQYIQFKLVSRDIKTLEFDFYQ